MAEQLEWQVEGGATPEGETVVKKMAAIWKNMVDPEDALWGHWREEVVRCTKAEMAAEQNKDLLIKAGARGTKAIVMLLKLVETPGTPNVTELEAILALWPKECVDKHRSTATFAQAE